MDDLKIVELFLSRNEDAIKESQRKYSRYCSYIASNILASDEDAEECVNDTLLRAWNSIPPAKPQNLKAYLGTITRNLALDRCDRNGAKKRSHMELAFEELAECLPCPVSSDVIEGLALKTALNKFLSSLDTNKRIVFMQRYWYLSSVKDIAECVGLSENNVKVILLRLRAKLKKFLEKEGVSI